MSTLTVPAVPALSPESTRRLRDLSDSEFKDTYGCDRFSASVILNRLRYAVEHMSTGFMREAFSPIIRDWYEIGRASCRERVL